jgi:hypothetical protein
MSAPLRVLDIPRLFDDLKQRHFYGAIRIEFNRGEPRMLRIEETRLIEETGETRSDRNRNSH